MDKLSGRLPEDQSVYGSRGYLSADEQRPLLFLREHPSVCSQGKSRNPCSTSRQATLGCAVSRSAPSSGLIPLLGRKEEPKDRKGDRNRRLSVFPPAQPARGGGGSQRGRRRARAALLGLDDAWVLCLLLRYPRAPQRSSAAAR